ncbi:MAG: type II toxin-antitoxin system RelE/ParE family toxin [Acidobacteriia bacterium]|nr:type II toxin-antitoxin system RelE/ParE family toxin [Terriglobia bacterium]
MAWTVSFEPRALGELKKVDRPAQRRVARFLQERIAGNHDPRDFGKPLTSDKVGLWRYRIGQYRIVCRIDNERRAVLVLRIAHRKDVYR